MDSQMPVVRRKGHLSLVPPQKNIKRTDGPATSERFVLSQQQALTYLPDLLVRQKPRVLPQVEKAIQKTLMPLISQSPEVACRLGLFFWNRAKAEVTNPVISTQAQRNLYAYDYMRKAVKCFFAATSNKKPTCLDMAYVEGASLAVKELRRREILKGNSVVSRDRMRDVLLAANPTGHPTP